MPVTVIRVVALIAILAGSAAAASEGGNPPKDWSTYDLLDVRNPASLVPLVQYRHHRTSSDSVALETRLLLRSGNGWRDATPRHMKWGIDDAYFVDARHGWLVTSDCAAGTGAMYRTWDGGRTWHQLNWSFTHNCAAGSGFRLMFLDRRHGWVAAPTPNGGFGVVFRTLSGGRSWASSGRYTGPVLDEVVFRSARVGWGIGLGWIYPGPLYRTADSSRTWKPEPTLPALRYSTPVVFGKTAVVMGTRSATAHFYRRLGGRWQAAGELSVRGVRFPDFRASTPHTWWVYGVEGSTPVVLVTANSGRTWTTHRLQGRGYYANLAVTGDRAWLATTPLQGPGALYSSGDLGRTWSRVSPGG